MLAGLPFHNLTTVLQSCACGVCLSICLSGWLLVCAGMAYKSHAGATKGPAPQDLEIRSQAQLQSACYDQPGLCLITLLDGRSDNANKHRSVLYAGVPSLASGRVLAAWRQAVMPCNNWACVAHPHIQQGVSGLPVFCEPNLSPIQPPTDLFIPQLTLLCMCMCVLLLCV